MTVVALAALLQPQFGAAQPAPDGPKLNVIRDTEIEELLRDYMRPILKVAKLGGQNIDVVLIGDRAFNAFVADGRRIFVNIGALYEADTPNQIIGVLAHETGHIAGGHLARLREQISTAQTAAIVALLVALGAAVGGVATNSPGISQALPGLMTGPPELIRRSLLSYVRQQEEAADRAAVNFLNSTGQSTKGMLETFQRFADQTLFLSRSVDPYTLSHPMPRERIAALEALARESPYYEKRDSAQLQARHDMMRAKLSGFVDRQDALLRRYPSSNNSLTARYARAIGSYRFGNMRDAITSIDSLIAEQPEQSVLPRIERSGASRKRAREGRDRAVAPRGRAITRIAADPDDALREPNPPKDEEPIEWMLLTTLPIETLENVRKVVEYYCVRWWIEVFFKTLKSGCRVEQRRFEDIERLLPCLAMYLIVAWRTLLACQMGRQCPDLDCEALFEPSEWKAVWVATQKSKPPKKPPSLQQMVHWIAGLGGYIERKKSEPGPQTMWIGMQRMYDLAWAWDTFGPGATITSS